MSDGESKHTAPHPAVTGEPAVPPEAEIKAPGESFTATAHPAADCAAADDTDSALPATLMTRAYDDVKHHGCSSKVRLLIPFPADCLDEIVQLLSQLSTVPTISAVAQCVETLEWEACWIPAHQNTVVMIASKLLVTEGPENVERFLAAHPPSVRMLVLQDRIFGFFDLSSLIVDRVCGCLTIDSPLRTYLRAIHAVCAGELWFPRWAMTDALNRLLEGRRFAVTPAAASADLEAGPALNVLSEREQAIVVLLRQGLTNKEIARRLGVSDQTVKMHLRNVFRKLGAHNRTQLALRLRRR